MYHLKLEIEGKAPKELRQLRRVAVLLDAGGATTTGAVWEYTVPLRKVRRKLRDLLSATPPVQDEQRVVAKVLGIHLIGPIGPNVDSMDTKLGYFDLDTPFEIRDEVQVGKKSPIKGIVTIDAHSTTFEDLTLVKS